MSEIIARCLDKAHAAFAEALPRLSPRVEPFSRLELKSALNQSNFYFLVAEDVELKGQAAFVGYAVLHMTFSPDGWTGSISSVVVEAGDHTHETASKLMTEMVAIAQEFSDKKGRPLKVVLAAVPADEAAKKLYEAFGFMFVSVALRDGEKNFFSRVFDPKPR